MDKHTTEDMETDLQGKVVKYEQFLNGTLRNDLEKNEQDQRSLVNQITDYRQLRVFLNQLKNQSYGPQSQMKVQTDLGSNIYVQAVVNDTKHVLMFCGLGIYLQMTVDDAIEFSEKREKVMEDKLNIIVSEASKIKATMKLVLEGLRELERLC